MDNLSNSNEKVLDGIEKITGIRPAFEKVDCCDYDGMERVFKKYPGIQGIIHFAASKAVGESVEKPLMYYRNNLMSLIDVLPQQPDVADQPVGTDACLQREGYHLLQQLYRLWSALTGEPARDRECAHPEGHVALW